MLVSHLINIGLFFVAGAKILTTDANEENANDLDRSKRLMVKQSSGRLWPKAILPYEIQDAAMKNKPEYERIIAIYEAMSCVRMVYWNESVPQMYGLNHKGRFRIIQDSGCYTDTTGYKDSVYTLSCCTKLACMHEIGHALGFYHEQVSPVRDGWIRSNWNDIWPSNVGTYKKSTSKDLDLTQPYDTTSIMHYDTWIYGIRQGSMTLLFPKLHIGKEYFYLLMELARGYKCAEFPQCDGKTLGCGNDGYQTIFYGMCQCVCPSGLDPDNLCKTPLQKVTSASWPKGQYGLHKLVTGCPDDKLFKYGQITTFGAVGNGKAKGSHIDGRLTREHAELQFCTRTAADDVFDTEDAAKFNWPIGIFCIYMHGDKCPTAFDVSTVKYNVLTGSTSGEVPKGSSSDMRTVEIKICCQYRGFTHDPVIFPTEKPFALIKSGSSCQAVTGMRSTSDSYTISSSSGFKAEGAFKHWINIHGTALTVPLCYYRPIDMACGGSITLSKSNPEATIEMKADGRTDLECTWVIKGDNPKSTLVFDFEDFQVRKKRSTCIDTVEVRYARIGQRGIKYCGEKPEHSIRSITDKLLVRFFTEGKSKSRFKARIKMTVNDDMCYDVAKNKGVSYDGSVNYTRLFEPCLPWAEMTECYHHPFLEKDVFAGLDGNACRNPDNSFRPWCYTDKVGCKRRYCDVCGLEIPRDKLNYCDKLKEIGFCTTNATLAVKYCPKTCIHQLPGNDLTSKKYTDIKCGKPTPPSDSEILGNTKSSYKLGETVQYKCKSNDNVVSSRCMTSGHWSEVGSACFKCSPGTLLFDNQCYQLMEGRRSFDSAREKCSEISGTIAFPKTPEESGAILKAAQGKYVWIGLTDNDTEGTWKRGDGVQVIWRKDQTDFVSPPTIQPTQESTDKRPYICVTARRDEKSMICEDFLGGQCSLLIRTNSHLNICQNDFASSPVCTKTCEQCHQEVPPTETLITRDFLPAQCEILLALNPKMCQENMMKFAVQFCAKTCNMLRTKDISTDVKCKRPTLPSDGMLLHHGKDLYNVGDVKRIACKNKRWSIYLTTTCLNNGKWSSIGKYACTECPPGYYLRKDQCYGFVKERLVYADARDHCKMVVDGYLATPKTPEENEFISSLRQDHRIWIGLDDLKTGGKWEWVDGTAATWTNWNRGEPNNLGDSEHAAVMNSNKKWNDLNNGNELPFVCVTKRQEKSTTGCVDVLKDKCPEFAKIPQMCTASDFGAKYCAKSCNLCQQNVNPNNKYTSVRCQPPTPPSDGVIAGKVREYYSMGDAVQITCKNDKTKWTIPVTTTCLTNGQWSPVGLACTACPMGYFLFNGQCYGLVDKEVNFDGSHEFCEKAVQGKIVSPTTPEEERFVFKLRLYGSELFGLKASDGNGTGLSSVKNSPQTWANWDKGEPNNMGNEDCAVMKPGGRWNDDACWGKNFVVCAVTETNTVTDCVDMIGSKCQTLLKDRPTFCQDQPKFANKYCCQTCQVYPVEDPKCNVQNNKSNVITLTTQTTISEGESVSYRCERFTYPTKGSEHQACLRGGKLSGDPLQCEECPLGFKMVNDACHGLLKGRLLSFKQAQEECKRLDGFIAMPKTQAENEVISSLALNQTIWVGISNNGKHSPLFWSDRSSVTWSNWRQGEEKKYLMRDGCYHPVMYSDKLWGNEVCDNREMTTVCSLPKTGGKVCYDRTDKGSSYDGNVSVSADGKTCRKWSESGCDIAAFKRGFERHNLESNYCRNPDNSDRPWCYTEGCSKAYCDVCKEDNQGQQLNIVDMSCKPPSMPSDGEMVSVPRTSYKLGDVVTIKCKRNKFLVTTTCLTSGGWSTVGYACTECPVGYTLFKDTCYRFMDMVMGYDKAVVECGKMGGHLPRPKTLEENSFIKSLNHGKYTWFDARKREDSGYQKYEWSDGTDVEWLIGKSRGFDCGLIDENGKWSSTRCDFLSPLQNLICATPRLDTLECRDFLEHRCTQLMKDRPTICQEGKEFAKMYCAKACGTCGQKAHCNTVSVIRRAKVSAPSAVINVGQYVEYTCTPGTFAVSGSQKRVCMTNGQLSGTDIVCDDCPDDYVKFHGSCYGFVNKYVTFDEAVKECKKVNGYVASPKTEKENGLVSIVRQRLKVWLGVTDRGHTGDYRWQDKTKMEWTNWFPEGQPTIPNKGNDCVILAGGNRWIPVSCNSRAKIVCETPSLGDEKCYDASDKGTTYDGTVNVTTTLKPCIHWAKATGCANNPFKKGDEEKNLVNNYCRNPDDSPGPWCYIDAETCDKQYCSVCNFEQDVDASKIRCGAPSLPADGALVNKPMDFYRVGSVVDVVCKDTQLKYDPLTTTCLTSGQWSSIGTACPECPPGYDLFKDQCYKFIDRYKSYQQAREYCKKEVGGYIAMPKSQEINNYIFSRSHGRALWIGMSDLETEGKWVWEDGTLLAWSNWQPGEPNDWGREDAGFLRLDGKWNDVGEDLHLSFVCSLPVRDLVCEDFLLGRCQQLLENSPEMCKEHPEFATKYCIKTCKKCRTRIKT